MTGSGGKRGSQETPSGVRLGVFAPHGGRSEISAPVWNLEVTDWLRCLPPFPLLLCPPFPLAPLPVLPHLPLTFTLPSAPLPARLICVVSLICIHMSQKRKRGFVGRRNRRGKRRYAGRWRLMKRDEKHSFRPSLSLPLSLSLSSPSLLLWLRLLSPSLPHVSVLTPYRSNLREPPQRHH